MAEIRVAKSAGFKPFAGERSRGTSTGRRRRISVRKFKPRSHNSGSRELQQSNSLPQSAITITQSCQRTTIHAQQRFDIAAKNHP